MKHTLDQHLHKLGHPSVDAHWQESYMYIMLTVGTTKPYVYAPLPFESITFLPFTHLSLPQCLSDFVVRFGGCLTYAV